MVGEIVPVEAKEIVEATETIAKSYDNYVVLTQEGYAGAGDDLLVIKSKIKELTELRLSLTRPIDESKKRIMDFFKKPIDFLENARVAIDKAAKNWWNEQERLRQAEEQRLADIQRKEAERLEKEAAAAEEKAIKFKTAKAKEAAQAKADELRSKAEVVSVITPIVESKVEGVAGMTMKDNWRFRIVDVEKIPREYMTPDEKLIGSIGRATRGQKKIEGVEFYNEKTIVSRR
jgi:hypothetical protein